MIAGIRRTYKGATATAVVQYTIPYTLQPQSRVCGLQQQQLRTYYVHVVRSRSSNCLDSAYQKAPRARCATYLLRTVHEKKTCGTQQTPQLRPGRCVVRRPRVDVVDVGRSGRLSIVATIVRRRTRRTISRRRPRFPPQEGYDGPLRCRNGIRTKIRSKKHSL